MVDSYGFHVGKYTDPRPMGIHRIAKVSILWRVWSSLDVEEYGILGSVVVESGRAVRKEANRKVTWRWRF